MQKDIKDTGVTYEEIMSENMNKNKLKTCVKSAAFSQLLELQKSHKKIKLIVYPDLKLQPYLASKLHQTKRKHNTHTS